jgi:hypothetical protein
LWCLTTSRWSDWPDSIPDKRFAKRLSGSLGIARKAVGEVPVV